MNFSRKAIRAGFIALVAACALLSACTGDTDPDTTAVGNTDDTPVVTATPRTPPPVLEPDEKIHANIRVGGVDIGGLTAEEATDALYDALQKPFDESSVRFLSGGEVVQTRPFSDFAIKLDLQDAIVRAYQYTREGDADTLKDRASKLKSEPLLLEAGCAYDTAAVSGTFAALEESVVQTAVEPRLQIGANGIETVPGRSGLQLDMDATFDAFVDALNAYRGDGGVMEVALTMQTQEPSFTQADLTKATSLLGTWTTKFTADANRTENVRLSAASVHNTCLMPGELFSTNECFGDTSAANGYKPGGTYENGKLVVSIGGGICQTSSTLYRALLEAELKIVTRTNHSMSVSYMPMGFDATLAGNYIDMKFENSSDLPILLETIIEGNTLTVNVYGHETRDPARRIEYTAELVATIEPPPEIVIEDPTLPLGERVVESAAKTGYQYKVYKTVYMNNSFVEKVHVNNSNYRTVAAEVRVGTGPAATPDPNAQVPSADTPVTPPTDTPATPLPTPDVPVPTPTPDAGFPGITTPDDLSDMGPLMP